NRREDLMTTAEVDRAKQNVTAAEDRRTSKNRVTAGALPNVSSTSQAPPANNPATDQSDSREDSSARTTLPCPADGDSDGFGQSGRRAGASQEGRPRSD